MKNSNNFSDEYEKLLSYFISGNLCVEGSIQDVIEQFNEVILSFKDKADYFQQIKSDKAININEFDVFLQNFNHLINLSKNAEELYGNYQNVLNSITEFAHHPVTLIFKIPFVKDIGTSPLGGRVWGRDISSFYAIDHQNLLLILQNFKQFVIHGKKNHHGDSEIVSKMEELTAQFHYLRHEYVPYAVFVKIPSSIEKVETLLKELKKLIRPFVFIIDKNFFMETLKSLNDNLEMLNEHLTMNSNENWLELKGKLKKVYRILVELTEFISF